MAFTIYHLTHGIPSLGSCAGIIQEISAVLGDQNSTLANLAEVVEKDPDLTARLLKLGNSAFFGFPSRLETVSDAINLIGIQQVQDLILASSVVELFEGISPESVNMESFWKHSLACAVGARCLAVARQLPKAEKFFVAGLLHDLGRLVLLCRAPAEAARVISLCQGQRRLMRDVEFELLGFDHTHIGESLMKQWQYPPNLVSAVAFHHHPMSAGVFQLESSVIHLADYLVHAMQMGGSGERFVPPLNARAWERLGLSTVIIETVIKSIDEQIEVVRQVFLAATRRPKPLART